MELVLKDQENYTVKSSRRAERLEKSNKKRSKRKSKDELWEDKWN